MLIYIVKVKIMKKSFVLLLTAAFVFVTCLSLNNLLSRVKLSSQHFNSSKFSLVIDPGHGGRDAGTNAADMTLEKDINLAIAQNLHDFAAVSGMSVSMTRTGDYLVYGSGDDRNRSDLYNRYDYINSVDNALLVSIHQNHYEDTSQWGMQIWYTVNDSKSKQLADRILEYDKKFLQPDNQRTNKPSDDSYYLLYKAKVPSVMVECGFMSNVEENNLLKTDEYRQKVAYVILLGLNDMMKEQEQ